MHVYTSEGDESRRLLGVGIGPRDIIAKSRNVIYKIVKFKTL